MENSSDIFQR